MKLRIQPPLAGHSDFTSDEEQSPFTTKRFLDVRSIDPTTGQKRLCQRAGHSNYLDALVDPTNPIVHMGLVTFESRKVTYADLNTPTLNWSKILPSRGNPTNIVRNFKGDVYVLYDNSAIVKYNGQGQEVEKVTVPVADKDHICRALCADGLDNFYVGVSTGGDQAKAKLWKYKHNPDGSITVEWTVDLGMYAEDIEVSTKTGFLYTCQNDPKNWKGWITTYQNIQTTVPNVAWSKKTGYPVNALAVNAEGAIIAVHEPNTNRGLDPNDLTVSAKTVDWTWDNLVGIGDRKHALFDARITNSVQKDIGSASLPILDIVADDGDKVAYLRDLTGFNRDFFQTTDTNRPVYRKKGFTGGPTISFDGVDNFMLSGTQPNVKEAGKDICKQVLPGWIYAANKGCGFLVWMIVKPTINGTKQCLLSKNGVAGNTRIWSNSDNAGVANAGTVWAQTPSATNFTTAPSYDNQNSAAIIVLVVDGANDGTQQTLFNVNGVYSNRFSATSPGERNEDAIATYLGQTPAGASFAGFELAAMGVLRSSTKTAVGSTTEVIEEDGLVTSDTEMNKLVGWLAHDFGLQHLLGSTHRYRNYPPSASSNASYPSVAGLLNNQNAFMAKWDSGGQLQWAWPQAINLPTGNGAGTGAGIGYGVAVSADGTIVTTGPKFAAATFEDSIICGWRDDKANVAVAWRVTVDGGATFTNHNMRLDTDKFNNFYVPMSLSGGSAALAATMQAYDRLGTLLYTYSDTGVYATNHAGYAVAADPLVPVYDPDVVTRAANFTVASPNNGTLTNPTIRDATAVSVTFLTGPPRDTHNLIVSSGSIQRFDSTALTAITGGSSALDSTSQFVSSAQLYSKRFFTDGKTYVVYDPIKLTISPYVSTSSGQIPPRCRLICAWRGRIVLARDPNDAHNWHMSKLGDPFNWDPSPPVLTLISATNGNVSATGKPPSIINCLLAYTDDLLLIFCERGIYRMTGDPMAGGQIDLISDITGAAFGRSATKDDRGMVYFYGSSGGVFALSPSGAMQRISMGPPVDVERLLSGIDLVAYRVELLWDFANDSLNVYVIPWDSPTTVVQQFVWERKTGSWAVDRYNDLALQPTAVMATDDPVPSSRVVLVASGGYVRKIDPSVPSDAGVAIQSDVLIGPLPPRQLAAETRFTGLEVVLASEQDGCDFELYVGDTAEQGGPPADWGSLAPGRNPVRRDGGRGARAYLRLFNGDPTQRWAFESGVIDAVPAGGWRER